MSEGRLKFLSYNIDGLNPVALAYRTNSILACIMSEHADVVQLQEVVADTAALIIKTMVRNGFTSFHEADRASDLCHYFTLSFVRTAAIKKASIQRITYTGDARSEQGRNSLELRLNYMGQDWLFINCHLESCGVAFKSVGSTIRCAQLSEGLEKIQSHPGPAILAGDLNIRDPEANKIFAEFKHSLQDASLVLETKKSSTWYIPGGSYSARYDRAYSNRAANLRPVGLKIIGGDDIITGTGLENTPYNTPSDHRGLVVTYAFDTLGAVSTSVGDTSSNVTTAVEKPANMVARNITVLAEASSKKRSNSTIPDHAEVINLDDSDEEGAVANKRIKRSNTSETTASINTTGAGNICSAQERRELMLRALDKRNTK